MLRQSREDKLRNRLSECREGEEEARGKAMASEDVEIRCPHALSRIFSSVDLRRRQRRRPREAKKRKKSRPGQQPSFNRA
ncbi:hypothetical protein L596_025941 [Steinernema carpocapsae]|uniref:Uncharacterized protein n=1 Tax=Steinernema carpocapsae TaxID=34508 RepID=A0A4U5M9K9_STECR|nr:hypothetical protein L596_025941 [Steinernema carpocapsae]